MKIAIVNDTHWGARNDSPIFADYVSKFYKEIFFPKIDELGIDTVFHLGDILDRRKFINFATAKRLEDDFMKPLRDRDITLHLLIGNHDTYYKNTNELNGPSRLYGLGAGENKLHIYKDEPVELEFDSTKIMLSPWICKENEEASLEAFRNTKAQILMGHFEIAGIEMDKGYVCEHGLSMNIFKKFDAVYSGHFHHPSVTNNIIYLGAPYEMTWTDYGGKRGFSIFDTRTLQMEHVRNPFKLFHKIHYDDSDLTVEDVENLDVSVLTGTYVKVIILDKTNPHLFEIFLDKIDKAGAADIRVVEENLSLDLIDDKDVIDEAQDTITIMSNFVDALQTNRDKKKIKDVLRELYNESNAL